MYNVRNVVQRMDDFFAYDVALKISEEFMLTPSDEYADWRYQYAKTIDNMRIQIYNFLLDW